MDIINESWLSKIQSSGENEREQKEKKKEPKEKTKILSF